MKMKDVVNGIQVCHGLIAAKTVQGMKAPKYECLVSIADVLAGVMAVHTS